MKKVAWVAVAGMLFLTPACSDSDSAVGDTMGDVAADVTGGDGSPVDVPGPIDSTGPDDSVAPSDSRAPSDSESPQDSVDAQDLVVPPDSVTPGDLSVLDATPDTTVVDADSGAPDVADVADVADVTTPDTAPDVVPADVADVADAVNITMPDTAPDVADAVNVTMPDTAPEVGPADVAPFDAGSLPSEGGPLFEVINDYRVSLGLDPVAFSPSLTLVAQIHVADLNAHYSGYPGECNLHSWSDDGPWSPCCYTSDHAQAQCMWDKPSELTDYPGNGYEISAMGGLTAESALSLWQGSSGHHDVIINEGMWSSPWGGMGAAIDGSFAVVWFGHSSDPAAP